MKKIACLFPGQGSQSVGMGKDLFDKNPVARQCFEEIDQIAGRSLSKLSFEGPEDELKRTVNTQPTILAVSLAAWKAYEAASGPKPQFLAGHSLGEFTALTAASALPLQACVRLVDKRAHLMEVCPAGAMSAVIGMSAETLEQCCRDAQAELADSVVIVANFNTREQLVISGSPEAVSLAGTKAKAAGAKVIQLPVGGAFHSPLMSSAAAEFAQELEKVSFAAAEIPVLQNYDALPATAASEIQAKLSKQMPSAVRWCKSIEKMLELGVDTFIEIGPGKALAGMVKKIERSAKVFNIYDQESLEKTLADLKETAAV
ncbi:MAG: ACP S-malonyltransferase [Candidatus Obscuribacterales bacterium]|nr:ACP S-malonyltransferase [Candidatus Obscuribacterales bacterium]